jgi:hypothetical protein
MLLVVDVVSCGDTPCFFQAFRLQEALQAMTLGSRRWLSNAVDRKKRADLEAFRATHNGYGLEVYSVSRMLCGHVYLHFQVGWLYLSHRDFSTCCSRCALCAFAWFAPCGRSHLPDLTFGQRMLLMGRKDTRYARCDLTAVATGSALQRLGVHNTPVFGTHPLPLAVQYLQACKCCVHNFACRYNIEESNGTQKSLTGSTDASLRGGPGGKKRSKPVGEPEHSGAGTGAGASSMHLGKAQVSPLPRLAPV